MIVNFSLNMGQRVRVLDDSASRKTKAGDLGIVFRAVVEMSGNVYYEVAVQEAEGSEFTHDETFAPEELEVA